MNVIINMTVFRNVMAVLVAVGLSLLLGLGGTSRGWYAMYLCFAETFCVPFLAMIATKREVLFGFFFVTLSEGIFAAFGREPEQYTQKAWLLECLGSWGIGLVYSLFGTVPIYLWRKWRRKQQKFT